VPRIADAVAWATGWAGRHRRLLVACAAALLVYTLLGFLLLPRILHRQLGDRLSALLHREVSIERVRTNPFALSLTIERLLVKQQSGTPGASWDRLYVNFDDWLSASLTVPAEDFRELASQRASAARDRILAGAQVDPSRVFLVEGGERAGKEKGARADFTLR